MQLTKKTSLILSAAMALPGVHIDVRADSPPEHGEVGFKYLSYQDSQPGLKRVGATAPSLYVAVPLAGKWLVDGSATIDTVSGASPRYHSAISSASKMNDYRKAGDVRLTRYENRSSYTIGGAYSTEHDYQSKSLSFSSRFSTEDNNTALTLGVGLARDTINPVNLVVVNERKKTNDFIVGITRVLTPKDLLQVNLTYATGKGYYSDPYKFPDQRPGARQQTALMAKWNHYFDSIDTTGRFSYRIYNDSFGVKAHTVGADFVKPITSGWTAIPSMRWHTQSAANFYYDPVYDPTLGAPFPPGWQPGPGSYYSADQRLSAFGAITLGLKMVKEFGDGWTGDAKFEMYQQKASYRIVGTGSPGLAPFNARIFQVGISKKL
jgi:Protein of unknown function (DUF3570)